MPKTLEKLKKLFTISTKINFEMICTLLEMDQEAFYDKIIDWAYDYKFTIDGDYIIINKDTMNDFITMIGTQFESLRNEERYEEEKE